MGLPLDKIFIAQMDAIVGDITGNVKRILALREEAKAAGAELVLFPELSICGYPAQDLLLRPGFRQTAMQAAVELTAATEDGGPAMLVGGIWQGGVLVNNMAMLMDQGRVQMQAKRALPNYDIFDEKRVFHPGEAHQPLVWRGHKLGVMVCEDMWFEDVPRELKNAGAEIFIVTNASPYRAGKHTKREEIAANAVRMNGLSLIYVNTIGGQDDLIFDGCSFYMGADGQTQGRCPAFVEALTSVAGMSNDPLPGHEEMVWKAAVLGLRDYARKNGFSKALLGISGGIDSAVVAAMAVDALGEANVQGVLLPSQITAEESNRDAEELGGLLGIETVTLPIVAMVKSAEEMLTPGMEAFAPHQTDWRNKLEIGGNLQSRIRGLSLMGLSNASGAMLLNTSNKSEIAVGYSTLYGDSCGAFSVLKDIYKTQAYALADWRNSIARVIPEASITRAPTAELVPGQKDQDQLPPYEVLDEILQRFIEGSQSITQIVSQGFEQAMVEKIIRLVRMNEYKRYQMPPGPRVSAMQFGTDWRYPMTNRYHYS